MVFLYWRMWKAAKTLQMRDRNEAISGWSRHLHHHTSADTEESGGGDSTAAAANNTIRRCSEGVLNTRAAPLARPTRASHEESATKIDVVSPRRLHRPASFFHAVRVPLVSRAQLEAAAPRRRRSQFQLNSPSRTEENFEDKARKTLGIIMSVFIGKSALHSPSPRDRRHRQLQAAGRHFFCSRSSSRLFLCLLGTAKRKFVVAESRARRHFPLRFAFSSFGNFRSLRFFARCKVFAQ